MVAVTGTVVAMVLTLATPSMALPSYRDLVASVAGGELPPPSDTRSIAEVKLQVTEVVFDLLEEIEEIEGKLAMNEDSVYDGTMYTEEEVIEDETAGSERRGKIVNLSGSRRNRDGPRDRPRPYRPSRPTRPLQVPSGQNN